MIFLLCVLYLMYLTYFFILYLFQVNSVILTVNGSSKLLGLT